MIVTPQDLYNPEKQLPIPTKPTLILSGISNLIK